MADSLEIEHLLHTAPLLLNLHAFIEHMKDINQLNEAQTFKMIINAIDLAETNEDLIAIISK
jgi:replication fork clamp-binding protein CrfC